MCEARQVNDQMMCGRCGLQWDVGDEDRPECGGIVTGSAPDELVVALERRRPRAQAPLPDAWVDDLGRVKFRLGLRPFPGMKLYQAPPDPMRAGEARVELCAVKGGEALTGVYVAIKREGRPDEVLEFVRK